MQTTSDNRASIPEGNPVVRTGASIQSLTKSVDRLSYVGHFCAIVVVIGVILEYRSSFIELFQHPTAPVLKAFIREALGGILVALGVAGELFFGFMADRADNRLRAANAANVDTLRLKIAELNLMAEREKAARAKIESELEITKRGIPRHLSSRAEESLMQILAECPDSQLIVRVNEQDGEARPFALQLGRLRPPPNAYLILPTGPMVLPSGIGIRVGANADDPAWADRVRRRLIETFEADGKRMSDSPAPPSLPDVPEKAIEICVGRKPDA